MVVSRCLLRRSGLRLLALPGLRRSSRRPSRPFTRLDGCSHYSDTVPSHRWRIMLPRMHIIFRSLCRTSENRRSIGLVDISVWRSSANPFSRCTVNSFSNDSAADSFLVRSTPPGPAASSGTRRSCLLQRGHELVMGFFSIRLRQVPCTFRLLWITPR